MENFKILECEPYFFQNKTNIMKILKYLFGFLFGAIALLILFFLAMGFLNPSVSYGHKIEVEKSIEEAWEVHKDVSKFGEWLDGFKNMELISGEPEAVGSKYKVTVQPDPNIPDLFEMVETVVAMKKNDHVTLTFDSDMMVFDQTTSFSEKDGKTVIETDSKVIGKGLMMRAMFAIMEKLGGSFTAQEAKNIEQLKKVIETNTTDYFLAPVVEEIEEESS